MIEPPKLERLDVSGLDNHTVWRWIRDGKLPAQKVGNVVLIEKRTVEKLKKKG